MADRILIVDDDATSCEHLEMILTSNRFEVSITRDAASALARIDETPIDVVLCGSRIEGLDGFALFPQIARKLPDAPVVMMTHDAPSDPASDAMRLGAFDYLAQPFVESEVLLTLHRALGTLRARREREHARREATRALGERPIVAASSRMIELLELVERTAAFKTTALLTGEGGTGKEVVARAIHAQSPRRGQPFLTVRCSEASERNLECELFGHVKGAHASARGAGRGSFERAMGGTLLLEEVASLPAATQAKLVRVLQDDEVRPVGGNKPVAIDVRVIAATSSDLESAVARGSFREDLYYRLNVMHLPIPALRERREDIPLLCDHFLAHFRDALGKPVRSIADDALERMKAYAWPGNVRELENVIERSVMLSGDSRLGLAHLPREITESSPLDAEDESKTFGMKRARRLFEIELIGRALRETHGNRTHAAKLLEISHRALLYKIKEYGIRD